MLYDDEKTLEECLAETWALFEEAKQLDDDALFDEVRDNIDVYDFMIGTEDAIFEFLQTGHLTGRNRSLLEGAYVIIHGEMMLGADWSED
jgi:hypothetical protein